MKTASVFALIFGATIVVNSLLKEDKTLKLESEFDLQVFDIKRERGFLTLQDSVVVFGGCKLIPEISKMKILESYKLIDTISYQNFTLTLNDVIQPYRILKKPSSDTLIIYHYLDTLYFKLDLIDDDFFSRYW